MKLFLIPLFLFVSISVFSQKNQYNIKNGFIANGYDVVSYFTNKSVKGQKKFAITYDGVKLQFSSKENLEMFQKSPEKYMPQYGGYCAYAIATTAEKVVINPKFFEIRDGKLYLFYNAWGVNTLKSWKKEGAQKLQKQADKNWQHVLKETN